MRITNDLELLATIAGQCFEAKDVVVLVAGTGSIAMRYQRQGNCFRRIARAGGWGPLLGDDGSGFDIGRKAIRLALNEQDCGGLIQDDRGSREWSDPLVQLVGEHLQREHSWPDDTSVLDAVLLGQTASSAKQKIASCAQIVLTSTGISGQAQAIVDLSIASLTQLVRQALAAGGQPKDDCVLVLAGGLMQDFDFRSALSEALDTWRVYSGRIERVDDLASDGARYLAQEAWRLKSPSQLMP